MHIVHSKSELRTHIARLRAAGWRIGFVPTMGALHEGHISLLEIARGHADAVVASIFVNPAQFAPHEDFDAYPRTVEADLSRLEAAGVDVVYLPTRDVMYPEGFDLAISVGAIGQQLEGVARPHFFDGVALVVTKLLQQVQPDVAVFGEKDFQQLHVIRKLVLALDIPVEVIGAPIMREASGLAMSSRNSYLTAENRDIAAGLYATLQEVSDSLSRGEAIAATLERGREALLTSGFDKVDYLELRDAQTLIPSQTAAGARLLAAVYLQGVRLIDNVVVGP